MLLSVLIPSLESQDGWLTLHITNVFATPNITGYVCMVAASQTEMDGGPKVPDVIHVLCQN